MAPHEDALKSFQLAMHGQAIPNVPELLEIGKLGDPQNWLTLSRGVFVLSADARRQASMTKKEADEWFDELCGSTSREVFSGLYDFSWSLAAYAICTKRSREVYEAMLAAASLCLVPAKKIALRNLSGTYLRDRNYGMAGYTGPISMIYGNRQTWDTNVASLYAERSTIGPVTAWAMGGRQDWDAWDHPTVGFCMDACAPSWKQRDGHHHSAAWADIELPSSIRDRVEIIDRLLPMRRWEDNKGNEHNQRLEIMRYEDGQIVTLLNRSTHNTRGPVLIGLWHPETGTITQVSPSSQRGGGEWQGVSASHDGTGWSTWLSQDLDVPPMTGSLPTAILKSHIIWDHEGCRLVGNVEPDPPPVDPDPPTDPEPPEPDPKPPGENVDIKTAENFVRDYRKKQMTKDEFEVMKSTVEATRRLNRTSRSKSDDANTNAGAASSLGAAKRKADALPPRGTGT